MKSFAVGVLTGGIFAVFYFTLQKKILRVVVLHLSRVSSISGALGSFLWCGIFSAGCIYEFTYSSSRIHGVTYTGYSILSVVLYLQLYTG